MSESKVLLVGDIHMSDKAPSSATESYADDLIDMLTWIGQYAHDNGFETIVWAGDIFHHKQPSRTSHATVLRMIEVLQFYRRLDVRLLIVIGNHDISNDVVGSVFEKQPLGVLLGSGYAEELNGWDTGGLPLFGVPWQQRWLFENTPMEALTAYRSANDGNDEGNSNDHALVVTHAPIYPPATRDEQMFDLVPTAGPHGLSAAMNNMGYLYYGHIHEDHGIWEDDGVTYANMGALSRGSLTEYNENRSIKVAGWSPSKGFWEIPVPHKPASEVLRINEVKAMRTEKKNLDAFLAEVGSSTLDISSTESVIEHIRTMDVEPEVKATAIEILEAVE